MASIIRIKRSEVSGNPNTLAAGELAYSALPDNGSNGGERLYIGTGPETAGNAANHDVIGGRYFTRAIDGATDANTPLSLIKRDSQGNFSASTITASSFIGNASSASKWASPRTITFSGDLSGSVSIDGTADRTISVDLATVNSTTGTFGSTSSIPVITVDEKGRITSVTSQTVDIPDNAILSLSADSGTDEVELANETIKFEGGTGVTTTASAGKVNFAIGQNVAPSANVTFNDITANGTLYSNNITAENITVDGNATISGNLTVLGTTTTLNTQELSVTDINITVAKDAQDAASANGAGLTVAGPEVPATLTYSASNDHWNFNKPLTVPEIHGNLIGNVIGNITTAETAEKLATARTISMTGDITYTSAAFDGTSNVTGTATLASVNSNTGSFGSSSSIPVLTVDEKGRITAVSTSNLATASYTTLGVARFSSDNFDVSSGLVSVSELDGGTY